MYMSGMLFLFSSRCFKPAVWVFLKSRILYRVISFKCISGPFRIILYNALIHLWFSCKLYIVCNWTVSYYTVTSWCHDVMTFFYWFAIEYQACQYLVATVKPVLLGTLLEKLKWSYRAGNHTGGLWCWFDFALKLARKISCIMDYLPHTSNSSTLAGVYLTGFTVWSLKSHPFENVVLCVIFAKHHWTLYFPTNLLFFQCFHHLTCTGTSVWKVKTWLIYSKTLINGLALAKLMLTTKKKGKITAFMWPCSGAKYASLNPSLSNLARFNRTVYYSILWRGMFLRIKVFDLEYIIICKLTTPDRDKILWWCLANLWLNMNFFSPRMSFEQRLCWNTVHGKMKVLFLLDKVWAVFTMNIDAVTVFSNSLSAWYLQSVVRELKPLGSSCGCSSRKCLVEDSMSRLVHIYCWKAALSQYRASICFMGRYCLLLL